MWTFTVLVLKGSLLFSVATHLSVEVDAGPGETLA